MEGDELLKCDLALEFKTVDPLEVPLSLVEGQADQKTFREVLSRDRLLLFVNIVLVELEVSEGGFEVVPELLEIINCNIFFVFEQLITYLLVSL